MTLPRPEWPLTDEDRDADRTMTIRARPALGGASVGHYLVLDDGPGPRRVAIGPEGLVIGRVAPCDLLVARPEISRRHCRVDLDGASAFVTDLGSTNGTFVGGRRVARRTRLRNGTQLALGTVPLRYEQRDRDEVALAAGLAAELRDAVEYVRAILPEPIDAGPVRAEWWFVPSLQLGGDAFGFQFLDESCFAGFVLDVSGHGIGPAMHAVAVANVLRRRALPGVDFRDPGQVAAALNATFPMEAHNGLMLTLWYFAYDLPSRLLRFCAAGHHPSFLVAPDAPDPVPLWLRSPTIGMLPSANWAVGRAKIPPGSRLYVFSDGAFEIVAANGQMWALEDLRRIMGGPEESGLSEAQRLYQTVRAAARPGPLGDDFSAMVVRFD